MSDFTVTDGDESLQDYEAQIARISFRRVVIELLRALARGYDAGSRVTDELHKLVEFSGKARTLATIAIDLVLRGLNKEALMIDQRDEFSTKIEKRNNIGRAMDDFRTTLAGDPEGAGREIGPPSANKPANPSPAVSMRPRVQPVESPSHPPTKGHGVACRIGWHGLVAC